ncbi:MAG: hypothetical protein KF778_20970 [Rhodocyclaceae bacterium]|nr:hypothetical protein [Rhodocyclaceae bacterium]
MFAAYSCEYIANIKLKCAAARPSIPRAAFTRRQDLLDLDLDAPDLSLYEGHGDEP